MENLKLLEVIISNYIDVLNAGSVKITVFFHQHNIGRDVVLWQLKLKF